MAGKKRVVENKANESPVETVENSGEVKIVNNGIEQTVEETKENKEEETDVMSFPMDKKFILHSETHAGDKVCGIKGIIEFDADGNALIDAVEAEHFANIPGYSVQEK